jgi:hypothetical protein
LLLFLDNTNKNPLSAKGEERVVERSKDRVSNRRLVINARRRLTPRHFVRDPLFAARKEGEKFLTSLIIASQTTKIRTVNEA